MSEEDSRDLMSKHIKNDSALEGESEGNMADPPINVSVTGVTGGQVKKATIVGINHGGINTYVAGPDPLADMLDTTADEVKRKTTGMVRVSTVDDVAAMMETDQPWVTITGNAGDGKTTLGYLLLKEFMQKNFKVFTLYDPAKYNLISKIKEKVVIMFDDRFGAFRADEQEVTKWFDVVKKLVELSETEKQKNKVIFISRKNVLKESKDYLGHLGDSIFATKCVVDLSSREKTTELMKERLEILEYHLHNKKLNIDVCTKWRVCAMTVAHGFPHCCKMFSELQSEGNAIDIVEFFKSPLKFLDNTTRCLYTTQDNCKNLFKLMIKMDGQVDVHKIDDENVRENLIKAVREQEGSYIIELKDGICQFAHPSVYESVLNVINAKDPRYCVQYATISVIRQKMIISTSDEEDRRRSPCYIIVKPIPHVLNALAERFREEVVKGDYSVFKLRLCQSREFCEALVSRCVTTDERENGSKRFINRPGEDEYTMLWTAFRSGNIVAVCVLMRQGASITQDVHDWYGRTPLHYLCQGKDSTADGDQHLIDIDSIRMIIKEGRGNVNVCEKYGRTPLHYLLKHQTIHAEAIKFMIRDMKSDPNQCEQHKSTPLHYLCAYSGLQLDTVDLVIKEGKGDFNKGDEHGTTPFHFLCKNGKTKLDVVRRIVKKANGDINKQDNNGITPLHVLCKGSLPMKGILTLINQGDKADMYGNTPLHFLCRRRGINAEVLQQQLEQIPETDMRKHNDLGYTPLDYLTDQDDSLPWTDGMIARSAADLLLCRLKLGDNWIVVIGRAMILNSERVLKDLQVEDFGRVLTNLKQSGDRKSPGQFSGFRGTCSSPVPVPPSPSPLTTPPSYWETSSTLRQRWRGLFLLQMGLKLGRRNMDEVGYVSHLPDSVCVSVWDNCRHHRDRLCIRVWRTDQEDSWGHQVGECVSLSPPTPGVEFTFTFGLVLDVGRGRVGFIDVERGQLLCKVDLQMKEDVFPMFCVDLFNDFCAARMRLISGREICVTDRKIHLIQQALSD